MASKLFVGNLPRTVSDGTLADFVAHAGFRVASAVVIRDKMTGDSKGFGFVELAEGGSLQRAIGSLDGRSMEGRPLTVNEAGHSARVSQNDVEAVAGADSAAGAITD